MSTHRLPIITITADMKAEHTNADSLELIKIKGWQVVAKKGAFPVGAKAIYIEPDFMVPTDRKCFDFLAREGRTHHRVRTIRLRKEISFGLLVPMDEFMWSYPEITINDVTIHVENDENGDIASASLEPETFGIERYVEKVRTQGSYRTVGGPALWIPKFDLESYQNYPNRIVPGEEVFITEKIHGANARYVYSEGKFWIGSRRQWIEADQETAWNAALRAHPDIELWCMANEDWIVFGEVYGNVQSLKYGLNDVRFAAFATLYQGNYHRMFDKWLGLPTAPVLYKGPFDIEMAKALAEEDSAIPTAPKGHMREGVVITPVDERVDRYGRVALKLISNRYWEQK